MSLSKPEIIKIAACPVCCAYRKEPCTFSRSEDPTRKRAAALQSHLPRIQLARKIHQERTEIRLDVEL